MTNTKLVANSIGILLVATALLVSGCARDGAPRKPPDWGSAGVPPDAVPRAEPKSRYGNPKSYIVLGKRYDVMDSAVGYVERGIASWYGRKFHGRRTSSGDTYNMYAMTAAHKALPLPTYVRVTNLANNRTAVLRVNDRGPFHGNRVIDLSWAAAYKLGILRPGTGLVEVEALTEGQPQPARAAQVATEPAYEPRLFVQVGAFSSRPNAEQLRAQLLTHAVGDVEISTAADIEEPVFRVRVGPLPSVEAADSTVEKLQAIGVSDHRVVID